jgi:hypothetical protein
MRTLATITTMDQASHTPSSKALNEPCALSATAAQNQQMPSRNAEPNAHV